MTKPGVLINVHLSPLAPSPLPSSRQRTGGGGHSDFSAFLRWGINRNVVDGNRCGGGSFYGTEKSSSKPIGCTWENYAWVAGNVGYAGCAWGREVWNEIDAQGGHILAPSEWGRAESHGAQNLANGATRNNGIHHMWVR
eukprot:m.144198 g.144198  ORF g.144198 m.144198 type:complete len:139 (+) comp14116_c0_seq2:1465-1881(+)